MWAGASVPQTPCQPFPPPLAETALDPLDDVVSADVIREICDFAGASRALQPVVDAARPFLLGHSRGGKLSVLAAARDAAAGTPRVSALALIDPVNNTVYAPQGPRFPSATAALRGARAVGAIPLLAVGGGLASADCAPPGSNHAAFYEAAQGPAWNIIVEGGGHFQFVDSASTLQRAVCAAGPAADDAVRGAAAAAAVAWGRLALFGDGGGGGWGAALDAVERDLALSLAAAVPAGSKRAPARPLSAARKRVP